MHTIKFDGEQFDIPSKWDELTREQFLMISELSVNAVDFVVFRIRMWCYMLGLTIGKKPEITIDEQECFWVLRGKKKYLLSDDDITFAITYLDWMFTWSQERHEYYLNPKLIKNLLPSIRVKGEQWYGPQDGLMNVIFIEYINAETAFYYLHKKKDSMFVDRLVACLYRPQKAGYDPESVEYDGDRREAFNDFRLEERQLLCEKINTEVKNAVLLWYTGCREYLKKRFPLTLNSQGDEKSGDEIFMGFMKMVNALGNNDVTKAEPIRRSSLYEVMITMEALALQDQKMKELYNK